MLLTSASSFRRRASAAPFTLCLLAFACGTSSTPPDEAGGTGSGASAGTGAAGGAGGVAATGGTGGSVGGSAGVAAGATGGVGGTGGASGAAGMPPATGGAGAVSGSAGTGAIPGGTGGQSAGTGGDTGGAPLGGQGGDSAGAGGSAGAVAAAGTGGGSNLHGGASGKYVCTAGATYGNPLTGMGSVGMITAPTDCCPNYFAFVEGPVWIQSLGKLFFVDNASPERIWSVVPGMMPAVFQENSNSNGMALDGDDKLVIADQVMNRITRLDPSMAGATQTSLGAAGCKPNDVVVRSDGNIYYSAPNQTGTGFFRMAPDGMVTGPRTDVMAPNGVVLSPDENTLYVGDVQNKSITKFSVAADGTIGATGSPFATTVSGTVDGMCVDCAGNVYAGTSNGIEVFSPDGMPVGIVPTGESSNCTFGGMDRKTLFVTSRSVLKTVTLAVPGLPD